MNQPKPLFHPLESPGEVTFWEKRRTLLLPVLDPSEFLALGVLGAAETVVFIARGKVREHLGDFVARMVEEDASVEFHAAPPPQLTALWREYGFGEGYESKNTEAPPPPPPGFQGEDRTNTGQALRHTGTEYRVASARAAKVPRRRGEPRTVLQTKALSSDRRTSPRGERNVT